MVSPRLSVLIPAHNEAGNLLQLLDEVDCALAQIEHEVLVVDDGSNDGSWELLEQLACANPRLRPLRHECSAGQSTAVWQAAWHARGEWLATLDGDGQNDPADIPAMLARAIGEQATLVGGQRVQRCDTWLKRLSSRVANRVRQALLHDDCPDSGCGLKIIRRDAFLRLPHFDHMHRFLPALICAQGGRCLSHPVRHRARIQGRSHYGLSNRLWAGIIDMIGVMWLRHRSRLPVVLHELEPVLPMDSTRETHPDRQPGPGALNGVWG